MDGNGPDCKSRPSVLLISSTHKQGADDAIARELFPTSISRNTTSPVDEVVLGVTTFRDPIILCLPSFRSPGLALLELYFRVITKDEDEDDVASGGRRSDLFSQAPRAIQNHSLLTNSSASVFWNSRSLLILANPQRSWAIVRARRSVLWGIDFRHI